MSYKSNVSKRLNLRRVAVELVCVFSITLLALIVVRSLGGLPSSLTTCVAIAFSISAFQGIAHALLDGYSASWRFFSVQDAWIASISSLTGSLLTTILFASAVPPAGWLIVIVAALSGVVAPRLFSRLLHRRSGFSRYGQSSLDDDEEDMRPALLLMGFGDQVADFIRSQGRNSSDYRMVGIVHFDSKCEANSLRGVPVLGGVDRLPAIVRRLTSQGKRPDYIVMTRDEVGTRSVGEILSITDKIGIPVAWLPQADRINPGLGQQLRPIKLDDLLPRSANLFDAQACGALLGGSTILVTGAGGSIGSELVRQIGILQPDLLVLTDASEHALYMIDQEISRVFPNLPIISKLLDVRDRDAVFRATKLHQPDYIFHAAALKHVPIVEAQACEGVITNVVGSRNVADAAAHHRVKAMVMVSTDKAVNPANVMGATKRLAEAYCQAMDAASPEIKGITRYVTVRFGNVLGSNGSVVPLFQKQLLQGGPLTVTHPDVERFFMTIPEASRLILQALLLGVGEDGDERGIFVLDMGKPVKIADLARQVIRLSGLVPDRDVKVVYTGLRPGEKLYEELMHETENLVQTEHPSLMVARPRFVQIRPIRHHIDTIQAQAEAGDSIEVLRLLKFYIPEFATTSRAAQSIIEKPIQENTRPEAI